MPVPADLVTLLARCTGLPGDVITDPKDLPSDAGAYLLILRLGAPTNLVIPKFAGRTLLAGWYLYAGSARGPGGIAARAGRHMRLSKPLRWHIDHLTGAAVETAVVPVPGGGECELAGSLARQGDVSIPLTGFGSSDCRQCRAHLLEYRVPVILNSHSHPSGNP